MRNQLAASDDFTANDLRAMAKVLLAVADWADIVRDITFHACLAIASDRARFGSLVYAFNHDGTFTGERNPLVAAVHNALADIPQDRHVAILEHLLSGRSLMSSRISQQPLFEAVM